MKISSDSVNANLFENIEKMNEMLKSSVAAEINLQNKMIKADVVEKVAGLGENIDVTA